MTEHLVEDFGDFEGELEGFFVGDENNSSNAAFSFCVSVERDDFVSRAIYRVRLTCAFREETQPPK